MVTEGLETDCTEGTEGLATDCTEATEATERQNAGVAQN